MDDRRLWVVEKLREGVWMPHHARTSRDECRRLIREARALPGLFGKGRIYRVRKYVPEERG